MKKKFIPYGHQWIDEDDIKAVVEVLKSDWLTTGPKVEEFERAFADYVKSREAVAVNSGTAALHAAMFAIGIESGDEVIVPPMTFAASANCVVFQGGTPVFADVKPDTLLLDPAQVEEKITPRTKAIITVDYTGHPCDYDVLRTIADRHGLILVADACHSLGGSYKGRPVGSLADLSAFSFHPVKHITTGEGGMITTNNPVFAERMRLFRNHGIRTDFKDRERFGTWFYQMTELGYNYRLTDIQAAIGISQLKKLARFLSARRRIARTYNLAFADLDEIQPLSVSKEVLHAYHLYVIKLNSNKKDRDTIFKKLRERGIYANVHYIPVHLHPFYREKFFTRPRDCPQAEIAYKNILTLPIFPGLKDQGVSYVIDSLKEIMYR